MLPGIVFARAFSSGAATASGSFITSTFSATASASYTFSGVSIGTADPTRLVVVTVGSMLSAVQPTSVTVAGNSATKASGAVDGGAGAESSIWYVAVSTGTTANIVVTFSGSQNGGCSIGVYSLLNLTSNTPVNTNSSSGIAVTSVSANVNTNNNGIVIASVATTNAGGAVTVTWTGVISNFSDVISTGVVHSSGLATGVAAAAPRTITASFGATVSEVAIASSSWS